MKRFLQSILKYIIVGVAVYLGTIVLLTYFDQKTFGFDFSHANSVWVPAATFFSVALIFIFDILAILDGKGKKKPKGDIDKVKDSKGKDVDQFFDKDFATDEDLKKNKMEFPKVNKPIPQFYELDDEILDKIGFEMLPYNTDSDLRAGDIIVKSSHIEIYAEKGLVFNCGDNKWLPYVKTEKTIPSREVSPGTAAKILRIKN